MTQNGKNTAVAIQVDRLQKSYPGVKAVDGVSFTVPRGEIFGLLGPNGAGKTSTLAILEGLRQADGGQVTVLGYDIQRQPREVKRRIGVQLQQTSLLPDLSAIEQLILFARLYGRSLNKTAAHHLLNEVGLAEKANALPDKLSGGQQQRLALALALVNDPEIVFLDEPTAGLDPQARRRLWELVRQLRDQGRTVVLTTHYMEEAEALCHRVGIMDHGRLLALDTPGGLINQLAGSSTITTTAPLPLDEVKKMVGVQQAEQEGALLRLQTSDPATINTALLALADTLGIPLRDLHVQQPSLEDLFLHLTGRTIRDA
ncbi:MAG: ABC transporter [Anaerolineaceae bacterium]|nr:ABC transporter [Anaerolineaceae bacterium]